MRTFAGTKAPAAVAALRMRLADQSFGRVRTKDEQRADAIADELAAARGDVELAAARRLGHDFGRVRVHTDESAGQLARAFGARAFTFDRDIVFGPGQYSPGTTEGRRLIAHELAHVAQQARTGIPVVQRQPSAPPSKTELINPFEEATEEEKAQETEQAAAEVEAAKASLREALARFDAISFLNKLRALDSSQRTTIEGDAAFMAELHKHFKGKSFWIVQMILRFGATYASRVEFRQLSLAVFEKNATKVKDLIRSFPELTDPASVPGVGAMLDFEFRGHKAHDEIMAIVGDRETGRTRRVGSSDEAHYEKDKTTGEWAMTKFGGAWDYEVARSGKELRVILRIRFVKKANPSETYFLDDDTFARWRGAIEATWNNRFVAENGTAKLDLVFVPMFTEANPTYTIEIDESKQYVRSDTGTFWIHVNIKTQRTVEHEFGHLIGNDDEYNLPATAAEIPASLKLSPEEIKRNTIEGITGEKKPAKKGGYTLESIMGSKKGGAEVRHVDHIVSFYNTNLKPASEAAFVAKKK